MSLEIERKFLVTSSQYKMEAFKKSSIKQGFLNTDKERVVRVRILDKKGFLTIKGESDATGTTRFEWEKEIELDEAMALLKLTENEFLEKNRYFVKSSSHTVEVDEFLGNNKGLIIAEIELNDANEDFKKPSWLGKEVTGEKKYYNSELSKNPFKNWQ